LKSSSRSHDRLTEIPSQTPGSPPPPLIVGARTFTQAQKPMPAYDITSLKVNASIRLKQYPKLGPQSGRAAFVTNEA
jgi:hypothetical protein